MHASGFEVREAHRDPSTPAPVSKFDVKAKKFQIRVLGTQLTEKGGRSTALRFVESSVNRSRGHLQNALQLVRENAFRYRANNLFHGGAAAEDQ